MYITMIVTNAYHPDPRVHKEAVHLVSLGHRVSVLCWDRHQEYLNALDVVIDGVRVIRFPLGSKLGSGLKQLPAFGKFIAACGTWIKANPGDAVHAHDLDGMLVAVIQMKKSVPITFDMHEYYEYTRKANPVTRPIIRWLVNRVVKRAKALVYVHPAQLEHLSLAAKAKAIHVPNYPEASDYLPLEKTASSVLRIGYIGKVRQYDLLMNLIEAAKGLPVEIRIHGDGVHADALRAATQGNPQVVLSGRYSHQEVGALYRSCDLLYVAYDTSTYQYRIVEPVKFYEAILTQTPILIESTMEIASWVLGEGYGFAVNGKSSDAIHAVLADLVAHPQKVAAAKTALIPASVRYRWQDVVSRLDVLYR
jgi:glycosyltransferase involved in cell wall biosynthesis